MTDPTDSRRHLPARSAFLQTRNPGRRVVVLEEDRGISSEHLPETTKRSKDSPDETKAPHAIAPP
jgi:hypothetical protein